MAIPAYRSRAAKLRAEDRTLRALLSAIIISSLIVFRSGSLTGSVSEGFCLNGKTGRGEKGMIWKRLRAQRFNPAGRNLRFMAPP
jgi:hypothetical protein